MDKSAVAVIWKVRSALLRWRKEGRINFHGNDTSDGELRWVFGVSHVEYIDTRHLEALAGVHGWAYYKMLVARKS